MWAAVARKKSAEIIYRGFARRRPKADPVWATCCGAGDSGQRFVHHALRSTMSFESSSATRKEPRQLGMNDVKKSWVAFGASPACFAGHHHSRRTVPGAVRGRDYVIRKTSSGHS